MEKIQDEFGKKIGGSKRDLWKTRNICLEDLIDMNEREVETYVKKDNVWKKPDYEKLVQNGVEREIAYFIKLIRDSLPIKPSDNTEEHVRRYINYIAEVRNLAESITSIYEIDPFYKQTYKTAFIEESSYYRVIPKSEYAGLVTSKTLKAVQTDLAHVRRGMNKKEFCMTDEQKVLNHVYIFQYNENSLMDKANNRKQLIFKTGHSIYYFYERNGEFDDLDFRVGEWFVATKNGIVLKASFKTKEDAEKWAVKVLFDAYIKKDTKTEKKGKKKFVPKQLQHISHSGSIFRTRSVTGDDYLRTFAFHGGEFGTWLNDNDRQYSLDYGYDAFYDLALALDIPSQAISMDGELSIAFGARGSGNALAHFEPLRRVINLTKKKGAGSLAHEYGHAIDYIIGAKLNGNNKSLLQTANTRKIPEVQELLDVMLYRQSTEKEAHAFYKEQYEKYKSGCLEWIYAALPDVISKEAEAEKNKILEEMVSGKGIEFDLKYGYNCPALKTFFKKYAGNPCLKNVQQACVWAGNATTHFQNLKKNSPIKIPTDFYRDSKKFDTLYSKDSHGYWSSNQEMFARAFACYIKDKLEHMGIKDDYLCGHADSCVMFDENLNVIAAYPKNEERDRINEAMDKLIKALKEKGYFPEKNISFIRMIAV